jgi:hypothetical protein
MDTNSHIIGLVALRKNLEIDENMDGVTEQQILGPIFKILKESRNNCLLYEATWCVILICLGPDYNVKAVLDRGIINIVEDLLRSSQGPVLENLIWIIGNLSGDSCDCRDMIL